jgi:uncharacterized protein YkuJ
METGDLVRLKLGSIVMVVESANKKDIRYLHLLGNKSIAETFSFDSIDLIPAADLFDVFHPPVNN